MAKKPLAPARRPATSADCPKWRRLSSARTAVLRHATRARPRPLVSGGLTATCWRVPATHQAMPRKPTAKVAPTSPVLAFPSARSAGALLPRRRPADAQIQPAPRTAHPVRAQQRWVPDRRTSALPPTRRHRSATGSRFEEPPAAPGVRYRVRCGVTPEAAPAGITPAGDHTCGQPPVYSRMYRP